MNRLEELKVEYKKSEDRIKDYEMKIKSTSVSKRIKNISASNIEAEKNLQEFLSGKIAKEEALIKESIDAYLTADCYGSVRKAY